jgi:tetratricopeptide (TPR) repeat protein
MVTPMANEQIMAGALAQAGDGLASGDHRAALVQAQLAVALAREFDARETLAEALFVQAQHQWQLGRHVDAVQSCQERLRLTPQAAPEQRLEVITLMIGALADLELYDDALAAARAAFELAHRHHLPHALVQALTTIGGLHGRLHDYAESESFLLQALSRARDQSDSAAVRRVRNSLLATLVEVHRQHVELGNERAASAVAERMLAHARQAVVTIADEPQTFKRVVMRSNVAAAFLAAGHVDDAEALLAGCLQQAHTDGFKLVEAKARLRLAQCHVQRGQVAQARDELESLLVATADTESLAAREDTLQCLARACAALGDDATAQTYAVEHSRLVAERQARVGHAQRALAEDAAHVADLLGSFDSRWGALPDV